MSRKYNYRCNPRQDGSVEAGLEILSRVLPIGMSLTREEIALACGCTSKNIHIIENRALAKMRVKYIEILKEKGLITQDLSDEEANQVILNMFSIEKEKNLHSLGQSVSQTVDKKLSRSVLDKAS